MNVFEELREFGLERLKADGLDTFETSLLGRVRWKTTEDGTLTGHIPIGLQKEANRYGLYIEAAFFKEGIYLLRLIH